MACRRRLDLRVRAVPDGVRADAGRRAPATGTLTAALRIGPQGKRVRGFADPACYRAVTAPAYMGTTSRGAPLMAVKVRAHARSLPTFVARIWLEPGRDASIRWRGKVRHVQADRETYFNDLGELRAFLEEVSGVPGALHDGKDHSGG